MLESLVNPDVAEKKPYELLLLAIIISIVATAMATLLGNGGDLGIYVVSFACIAAAPLMVHLIKLEEKKDEGECRESFLGRHGGVLEAYGYYFIGIIIGISLIFTILPPETTATVFGAQVNELSTIEGIRGTGHVTKANDFMFLFQNNLEVLVLSLVFSFVFGAGAIYIITWNASIVGVLIGQQAFASGGIPLVNYLIALPIALISLFPHGIFEVGAYLCAGLAGGMLSASMMQGHLPEKQVVKDIVIIFLFGVLLVAIGAAIEGA